MDERLTEKRRVLRREILQARDQLTPQERGDLSRAIQQNLWQLAELRTSQIVFSYVAFRSEVETLPLINQCLGEGKQLAVPLTIPGDNLKSYLINDPDLDLRPGYCRIPEPDPDRLILLAPNLIDVVLLPGSVFDRQGGRLGYGGGYYDRFLANLAPQAIRIGLAFELQVVEQVPLLSHDQLLDFLVTEQGVVRVKKQGGDG